MTANSRINIERLTTKDREELEGIAFELWALARAWRNSATAFRGSCTLGWTRSGSGWMTRFRRLNGLKSVALSLATESDHGWN